MKNRTAFTTALVLSLSALSCAGSLPAVVTGASDFTAAACTLADDSTSTPSWLVAICDVVDPQGNKSQVVVQVPAESALGKTLLARRTTAPASSGSASSSAAVFARSLRPAPSAAPSASASASTAPSSTPLPKK